MEYVREDTRTLAESLCRNVELDVERVINTRRSGNRAEGGVVQVAAQRTKLISWLLGKNNNNNMRSVEFRLYAKFAYVFKPNVLYFYLYHCFSFLFKL